MGRRFGRRWLTGGLAAVALGSASAYFVAGAVATHGGNVFSGQWSTNTGSVNFAAVDPATGMQALAAQNGQACSGATVYYVGTYLDPGPRTGVVSGCTVGGPTHLVGRFLGDPNTDRGSAGDIDITFQAPGAFTGTSTNVQSPGKTFAYTGTFQAHFAGDGCCPAPPTTTTTTTPTVTPPGPHGVSQLSVDALFPLAGAKFSGRVAVLQSSLGDGAFTATIDWGDGTPPVAGTVSAPAPSGGGFARSVSGVHTYARPGSYPVDISVTDPQGGPARAPGRAVVTACSFCAARPPVLGRTVDALPVSGRILIRLPGPARRPGAAGGGFVALNQAREIPVGSEIDARRGALVLRAGTATPGRIAAGEFSGGIFQVLQSRRELGLSELRLRSQSATLGCRMVRRAQLAAAKRLSRRVLGLLRASANGQFRTRGRFSSATVRGTEWTTTDRCDGTLTTVAHGAVTVRDFRARRAVVVAEGHSYLARGG